MNTETRPFRISAKLLNNRLIRAREEMGFSSAREAATALSISYEFLLKYERLSIQPVGKQGEWKPMASKIADAYGLDREYLWPDAIMTVKQRYMELEVGEDSIALNQPPDQIMERKQISSGVDCALRALSPRDECVIRDRFGLASDDGMTLGDIAVDYGVTKERIRQIETRAIRRLRERLAVVDADNDTQVGDGRP